MNEYSYSRARQQLATVLEEARRDGQVRIRRRDGASFIITPDVQAAESPLDVKGVDLDLTAQEIVALVREGRERP